MVNTRSLGAWLTAHFDRPGPYVLRQSKDRLRAWYVEPTEGAANARMPFYDDEYELPDGRVMTGTELFTEMSRLGAGLQAVVLDVSCVGRWRAAGSDV